MIKWDLYLYIVTINVFWTFHSRGVSIVNPVTCKIEHTFHKDEFGRDLPRKWSKGVYMQRKEESFQDDDIPLTSTPQMVPQRDAYILINSAESLEANPLQSEVIVLSTTSNKLSPVVERIAVGGGLSQAYGVHNRNQVSWAKDFFNLSIASISHLYSFSHTFSFGPTRTRRDISTLLTSNET